MKCAQTDQVTQGALLGCMQRIRDGETVQRWSGTMRGLHAAGCGGGVVNGDVESLPHLSMQKLILHAIRCTVVAVVPLSPSRPPHLSTTTTVIILVLAIIGDIDVNAVIAVILVILVVILIVIPVVTVVILA
ncbi:hypothetical protein EDD18DRAFT_1104598 [Armillaria luteobubalina]|uniref:Uncharacterized protein n=1 Tax=Armillaria luteobubalina TaxID=153913 RepID=A0AA39UPL7_9AGAR|nr:hypothetical protein EDD18DRAFT_1104598 [Armillaria luteobubalina]